MLIFCCANVSFAQDKLIFASGSPMDSYQSMITYPLLKEACKRNGINLEVKSYPSPRALLMSNSGALDGELHRVYEFHEVSNGKYPNLVRIECQLLSSYVAVFSKDHNIKISSCADLKDATVGYRAGRQNIKKQLSETLPESHIFSQTSELSLFRMVGKGLLDYVISESIEGKKFLYLYPELKTIKEVGRLSEMKIYAYINKKYSQLAPKIAATLNEMKRDGTFKSIVIEARNSYCMKKNCTTHVCEEKWPALDQHKALTSVNAGQVSQ
ncbi:extracellular solute-binding protein, family 3 [Desulfovibrio gilichinskyi]|uniref:Extracellular solute-binding protein, family 3 n=2 Tax=Desulfovibrio gilichinskyi TaxID=1519643 RepID=A0A1X7EL79_9BACT|nr:extracellular solute-binding protein, family 3 [Desulfovibrio gilichinskyi]